MLNALGIALPFPSLPDVGWLAFAPFALAGVYRLAPASAGEKAISALDVLATATAVGAVVAVLYYDRATSSELPTLGLALAYAVLYSAAAATIAQALCTRLSLLRRPDLVFLLAGLLAQGVAFSLWAGALLGGSYAPGGGPFDLLWSAGLVAIGIGALKAVGAAPVERTTERDIRLRGLLPVLAIVALTVIVIVFAITGAPLRERLALQGALLGLTIIFALRTRSSRPSTLGWWPMSAARPSGRSASSGWRPRCSRWSAVTVTEGESTRVSQRCSATPRRSCSRARLSSLSIRTTASRRSPR